MHISIAIKILLLFHIKIFKHLSIQIKFVLQNNNSLFLYFLLLIRKETLEFLHTLFYDTAAHRFKTLKL